jgi:hypothetical protein
LRNGAQFATFEDSNPDGRTSDLDVAEVMDLEPFSREPLAGSAKKRKQRGVDAERKAG